ncbi:MAG: DUF4422 domain-containing protein [Alphaproteobacteria bacterium]|nr:DUF4422 domain-containing protein [Alphaproteobacteria bacterium]
MDSNIIIYQFCHKEVPYGFSNVPLEVGAALREKHVGMVLDDRNAEDNISALNPIYAETTGMYDIWKNDNHEIVAQEQYRRRLSFKKEAIEGLVEDGNIIACQPLVLGGAVRGQFCLFHSTKYWDLFKDAVHQTAPEYDSAFNKWLESTPGKIYYSNGMAMYKKDYDRYCEFLFPVMEYMFNTLGGSVEAVTKTVEKDIKAGICANNDGGHGNVLNYQRQVPAFISERAFTMWARENFEGRIVECPYIKMENTII